MNFCFAAPLKGTVPHVPHVPHLPQSNGEQVFSVTGSCSVHVLTDAFGERERAI